MVDPALGETEREALALVPEVRAFAANLDLAVEDQYTHYVPWPGDRVLTNLVATGPGSLEPRSFHYPVLGALPYRGFFDLGRAEAAAQRLRDQGFDVCLSPVPAYSTLGWLADPVTEPMLQWGPAVLVEMLIHELVHATVFVRDDAALNEGLATFVGQEGAVRFFAARGGDAAAQRERARVRDDREIAVATAAFREEVATLYDEMPPGPARDELRAELGRRARARLAALPLETRDAAPLAAAARLNDACLALAATYEADLEAYARLLGTLDGDLRAFVARARRASRAEDPRARLLDHNAP